MKKPRSKTWFRQAKAKGRDWENAVCDLLREYGIPAERRRLTGCEDCGDVSGWDGVVVEAKACKAIDLAGWLTEARNEAANADARFGGVHHPMVIAKRHGRPSALEGYAILPVGVAVAALKALLREQGARP